MRIITCLVLFMSGIFPATAQKKVLFIAGDGLSVTADLYLKDTERPFILLFHQDECSRGEYDEIAPKLLNLNYNCLSVDLRSGGKVNYIENETAQQARHEKKQHSMLDAKTDILAAIQYVSKFNNLPVILFGSSYSGSLAMIAACENPRVKAVVAFSPGEYFRPVLSVREALRGFDKKLFVAADHTEYSYLEKMLTDVPGNLKTLFTPKDASGAHGAKALWESSAGHDEYWLALLMFFKELNGAASDTAKVIP